MKFGWHIKRTTQWKSILFNLVIDSRGFAWEVRLWWINVGGYGYRPRRGDQP